MMKRWIFIILLLPLVVLWFKPVEAIVMYGRPIKRHRR